MFTHKGCVCNEVVALTQRHQVDDGSRYNTKIKLKKYLRPLIRGVDPTTEDFIIARAVSSKKKLLEQAKETLETTSIKPSDGDIKMFLKDDKYPCSEELEAEFGIFDSFKYGAPRCIQYRNKRYCLRLATYLHPIEKAVYNFKDWTGTQVFSKSRNMYQRAQDLRIKWNSFNRPKALLFDHSKFDAHACVELLALEHWFYSRCNDSEELAMLLRMQLVNKGRTKNGTTYVTKGTRMSGDQNTGLGNSIINYAMLMAFVEFYKLRASIYVDGDDSVLVIEDQGEKYDLAFFSQFGMVTKGEETTCFEHVEFCQTRPVRLQQGWTMIRNPIRTLVRTPWTVKREMGEKKTLAYLASIGRCEMALGRGAPIGQYLGEKLASLSSRHIRTDLEWLAKQEFVRPLKASVVHPDDRARTSYALAWGISPDQQVEIEQCTLRLQVDVGFHEERPFEQ